MSTTASNRVISYFFLFDFYHWKGQTDAIDLLPESIIYFYPPKANLKKQKLLECGELIGLIQFFKYDLFSSIPKEFTFKRSLVTCKHYGRHCAFLVLPRDRFTTDEANIHLNHILQLLHFLYGTFNHLQSVYPDIQQMEIYLRKVLTSITEHVFNENRSIQNLFSAIDYIPLKQNNQRYLLNIKHLLDHLQATYQIKEGLFAYDKRIIYSTFDVNTTFYIQVLLALKENLPSDEIHIPLKHELKLKNGVSLIRIFIRRPASLEPMLTAVNARTEHGYPSKNLSSEPVDIINRLSFNDPEPSSLQFQSTGLSYSLSTSDRKCYTSIIPEDPAGCSSGELTDFDSDRADVISSPGKTETDSAPSSLKNNRSIPIRRSSKSEVQPRSQTDDDKSRTLHHRSTSISSDSGYDRSSKIGQESSCLNDSSEKILVEQIDKDDYETDCNEGDVICLPVLPQLPNYPRRRQRTLTSYSDLNDPDLSGSEHQHGQAKWGDTPETNDEIERTELILYVQTNSHLTFAGIIEKSLLSEEYLQKLWYLMVTEMADMDREIPVIPIVGEISKSTLDVKFQCNEQSGRVQFERFVDGNRSFYNRTPTADNVCMALNARTKLNGTAGRKMIGLSRGNHLVSINRSLPDRINYFCRRFQEPQ